MKKLHFNVRPKLVSERCDSLWFPSETGQFLAGGHRGAEIPVPIPNTAVKRPIAEGSVGPAHARVGRRQPFLFFANAMPRLLGL